MTPERYLDLRQRLFELGYRHEWEWAQALKPPADAQAFACEYVWVVLNSGMKNQIAEKIYDRVMPALLNGQPVGGVFGHAGKAAAIEQVWRARDRLFVEVQRADDKLAFCRALPWIGRITQYHLAKNLGIDCAKPDRWLERVAKAAGETVDGLCGRLSAATGDRVATVDLVIWRGCNLGLVSIPTAPAGTVEAEAAR